MDTGYVGGELTVVCVCVFGCGQFVYLLMAGLILAGWLPRALRFCYHTLCLLLRACICAAL